MASRSTKYRECLRFLEEIEKEVEAEMLEEQRSTNNLPSNSSRHDRSVCFLEELEKEVDAELLEAQSSANIPAPTESIAIDEAAGCTSNKVGESSGVGGGFVTNNFNEPSNTNQEIVEDSEDLEEHDRVEHRGEEFWDESYSFLNKFKSLKEALRHIVVVGNLSRNFVNLLLAVLRMFGHPDLPKDRRALVKTPKVRHEIKKVTGGDFWYQGVEVALRNYFKGSIPEAMRYKLQIFIDGLPLFKS
uniref:Uncharacterized protein n=1 Tax=Anopheles atroparvus TaxID=41427 RepID=A0AAG5DV19_ANOAO